MGGRQTAPRESPVYNPAFDVTPADLVTAIITERGVLRAPYEQSIQSMAKQTLSEPELATT